MQETNGNMLLLQGFLLFTRDDKGSESQGHGETMGADIQKGSWGMIKKSNQHNVRLKWQTFHFRPN